MTRLHVNLNKANKNCFRAVGSKPVEMDMFVRKIGNNYIFNIDGNEVEVKASWIKNLKDVEEFIAMMNYVPQTEEAKKVQALGLDWNLKDVDRLVALFNSKSEDEFEGLLITEAKRNSEMAWLELNAVLRGNK